MGDAEQKMREMLTLAFLRLAWINFIITNPRSGLSADFPICRNIKNSAGSYSYELLMISILGDFFCHLNVIELVRSFVRVVVIPWDDVSQESQDSFFTS